MIDKLTSSAEPKGTVTAMLMSMSQPSTMMTVLRVSRQDIQGSTDSRCPPLMQSQIGTPSCAGAMWTLGVVYRSRRLTGEHYLHQ